MNKGLAIKEERQKGGNMSSTSRLAEPLDAPKLSIIGCLYNYNSREKQTNQSIIAASRIANSRPNARI